MPESSSPSPFAYRAFISYSHRDKAWVDWLHKALETYRVPSRLMGTTTAHGAIPRRLNPVFRDRDELSSSPELGSKINQALAQSENLVVICSPASATSRWVNEEVLVYKRMGRAERVFCLIVDGEPNASEIAGRETEECFCHALRFQLDANGQPTNERTEPIAADARPGKDGKANAKLKLIAGMLDVGFDQLKQREQRRQVQRMTAIACTALVAMAVTIVLSIFAMVSRHRAMIAEQHAEIERHKAVVAQQAAVRRQKQAEGLVDFMLGDLTNKLQAESHGDILLSVGDKAMAYFQSLPGTDVNDTALAQRAQALEEIAEVRMDQGQVAGALQAFQASTAIASQLAAAAPNDAQRQAIYARDATYMGLIYQDKGELDDALREYTTAQRVLRAALKRAPHDAYLLEQLTYSENNLGDLFMARGQLAAAHAEYAAMLAASQKLIARRTGDEGPYQVLIYAHAKLARLATQRGDLATAIAQSRAELAAAIDADKTMPNDNEMRVFLVHARSDFGQAALMTGDLESAVRVLQQAVSLAGQLSGADPKNSRFQDSLGNALSNLARVQRLSGDMRADDDASSKAIAVLTALTNADRGNTDYERGLAVAETERSIERRAAGELDESRALAQTALHILELQWAKHPDDRDVLLGTVSAKLSLASVTTDGTAARNLQEHSLGAMQSVKMGHEDLRLLALEVQTLMALDRKAEAQVLIKQLRDGGYRDPEFVALMQRTHIAYPLNPGFEARLAAATQAQAVDDNPAPAPTIVGDEHQ